MTAPVRFKQSDITRAMSGAVSEKRPQPQQCRQHHRHRGRLANSSYCGAIVRSGCDAHPGSAEDQQADEAENQ